ncbi:MULTISPECIES: hypothetical protein [unclassified Alteromonas]|uniref:hypothetical protein n=1 Tax=unclassified Alteromonas TaxID=2614992 RepID=UPI000509F826|nr:MULTISPECIES: hypothetical protein [unclassified Alteromonas]
MKLIIVIGVVACLVAAVYLNIQNTTESPVIEKKSAPRDATVTNRTDDALTPEGTKLVLLPFPEKTLSDKECDSVIEESSADLEKRRKLALEAAMQAYLAGEPKEIVADAIWMEVGAFPAEEWFNVITFYEVIKQYPLATTTLGSSSHVASQLKEFQSTIESGRYQRVQTRAEQLFANVDVKPINRAIVEKRSLDDVISTIDNALAHIPVELLQDPQISPIKGLIKSSLEYDYYELSLALMERYPSLLVQESKYQNQFISSLLNALYQSISDEPNRNILKQIIALIQQENATIVVKDMPAFFGPSNATAAASKLIELGIFIDYTVLETLEPNNVPIDLLASTPTQEALRKKSQQCNAPSDWIESRRYKKGEWQLFEPTSLTREAVNSIEFKLCDVERNFSDFVGTTSAVKEALRDITMRIFSEGLTLRDVSPSELTIPELTDDERAVLIGLIADGYLENRGNDKQTVRRLMSNAGLFPKPVSMEAKQALLSMRSAPLWLETLDFNDSSKSYILLNQLAFQGKFDLFSTLISKIEISDEELFDPLFFFLQGYSDLKLTEVNGVSSFTDDDTENKLFADYFIENGYEFLPHHQRQMLEKKISQKHYFDKLVALFPQIKVSDTKDFFSVACE